MAFSEHVISWPFPPNWRDSVEITTSYRTDMVTSRSGKEQRRSLRTSPRRTLMIPVTAHADRFRQFMRSLQAWQNQSILIADPVRRAGLVSGVTAGSDSVTLATTTAPDWIAVGANIVFETATRSEVRTVQSIADAVITFTAETPYAWPANTLLRPALSGLLDGEIEAEHPTNRTVDAVITFAVDPGSESEPVRAVGMYLHGGREVFAKRPNWGDDVTSTLSWPVEQVDFGHGRIKTFRPVDYGTMLRQATYLGQNPDEAAEILEFFDRQFGRRGEFYMPTALADMEARGPTVSGTTTLRVGGTDVYDTYRDDSVYKAISLRFYDGRIVFRSITGMFVINDAQGDDTVLELDTEWLTSFDADEVVVSWMPVYRFGSDDLTFEWLTSDVAQAQISMQTLPDLTPEGDMPEYDGAARWVQEVWGFGTGLDLLDAFDHLVNVDMYEALA